MFSIDGKSVAGLGGQAPGMDAMPAIWNTDVTTDDVGATAAKVEAAGGSVMMPPMQVMTSGEMAVFADPTGAAFSSWKPVDDIEATVGARWCSRRSRYPAPAPPPWSTIPSTARSS